MFGRPAIDRCYYIAYGSNLHPLRLQQRLGVVIPCARLRLRGLEFCYRKRGTDGSGKSDLREGGGDSYGVLYQLSEQQLSLLDRYEGGYRRQTLSVCREGAEQPAVTYRALDPFIEPAGLAPLQWYQQLVLTAARQLQFPVDYQQLLAAARSQPDPDPGRAALHRRLLAQLRALEHDDLALLPWGEAYSAATIR